MTRRDWICWLLLYIGVALLLTHELDAVMHHEWRVLPLTSWLDDEAGYQVFLWAHVPLLLAMLVLLSLAPIRIRQVTATVLAVFLIAHAGLHWLFSGHQDYAFWSLSSNLLIYAAAVFGGLYLLVYRATRPAAPAAQ